MRYIKSVRFSEQEISSSPRISTGVNGQTDSLARRPPLPAQHHARQRLVEHADKVQAAIYALIRGYESTTGHSVIRLEYDAQMRRITLDALPLSK
jgi:hypothetical protein